MKTKWLAVWLMALELVAYGGAAQTPRIWILPIRQEVNDALLYTVRRGVKEAMQEQATILVLDMNTPGGAVDSMMSIMDTLHEFKGRTVTYVNKDAFSAGALIAISTGEIYMAPQSVIGAAAPIMLAPDGSGPASLPETVERKMVSAISAKVRGYAENQGHNPEVAQAMIDKTKGLKMDGTVINKEGDLLTLTNVEAEKEYGNPPKPLLSLGTVTNLAALLQRLGGSEAESHRVDPTGAEQLAGWIIQFRALILLVGILGIYLEFKMPGVVLPGLIGGLALVIYFFGGYVAGLSGLEWLVLFILGVILLAVEVFVTPGSMAVGFAGLVAMFAAVIMAMVDLYPGGPLIPTLPQLILPVRDIMTGLCGAILCMVLLARFLPKTRLYGAMVPRTASGVRTTEAMERHEAGLLGREGIAISILRPGGKARFDEEILDVISDGELVEAGKKVRVIGASGANLVVRVV